MFYKDPAGNYMFKVNNRNTRIRYEICSKLIIKAPHQNDAKGFVLVSLLTYFTPCSRVFIVNFEQVNAVWGDFLKISQN